MRIFFVEQKQVKQVHKLWVCIKSPKGPKQIPKKGPKMAKIEKAQNKAKTGSQKRPKIGF